MMTGPNHISIELISDATFGSGEGTPGEVDVEVEHDNLGLPYLGGKALHGLLRDTWLSMAPFFTHLAPAAVQVLGPSADLTETSILGIGDAVLDGDTRAWVHFAVQRKRSTIRSRDILHALTDIRYQTREDRATGGPAKTTLRSSRVILRGLRLEAPLRWLLQPEPEQVRVLALAALGTRQAGLGRNRGRGHLALALDGDAGRTRLVANGGDW
jgi:hypothetical protein